MWVWGGLIFIVPILFLVVAWMWEEEGDIWVPEAARAGAPGPVPHGARKPAGPRSGPDRSPDQARDRTAAPTPPR